MIKIWYEYWGQKTGRTEKIRTDANKAATLPPSFSVVGVQHGRTVDGEFRADQFALRVDPPSDNISTDAVDAIATAFEDNWGGTIEHVETVQV